MNHPFTRLLPYVFILWLVFGASLDLFLRLDHTEWGDTLDYFFISYGQPHTLEFWSGTRPGMMPLVFKLVGRSYAQLAAVQLALALASWALLAAVAARLLRGRGLRVVAFALLLLLGLSSSVFYWHTVMLTESLSNSLLVLGVALWLVVLAGLPRRRAAQVGVGLLLLLVMGVLGLLRDANAYLMLGAAVLALPLVGWRRDYAPLVGVLLLGLGALFVFQNETADRGGRWRGPLGGVFLERILPDPAKRAYFTQRGLPYSEELAAYVHAPEENPLPQDYLLWLYGAKGEYMRWLLHDPLPRLVEPLQEWRRVLDGDFLPYANLEKPIAPWQPPLDRWLYSPSGFVLLALLYVVGRLLAYRWRQRPPHEWVAPALLLLVYPTAFIIWHGDPAEIERHTALVGLMARLGLYLALLFGLERLREDGARRLARRLALVMVGGLLLQGLFSWDAFRARVLLPLQAELLPVQNPLRYWGTSDLAYQAYGDDLALYVAGGRWVLYPESHYIHLLDAQSWTSTPEQAIDDINTRRVIAQWRETLRPDYLHALGVGYLYTDLFWISTRTPFQQNQLAAGYEKLMTWDDPNGNPRYLYGVVANSSTTTRAEGLPPAYAAHVFDLLPPGARVFNPVTGDLDWFHSIEEIGALAARAPDPRPLFDLMRVWEQTRHQDDLTLTPEQSAALQRWRGSKEASDLRAAGFEYLLVSDLWWSYLSAEEFNIFTYAQIYELVAEWDAEIPGFYRLYRIN